MTIKYWEPSKDKIVKADVNELLPAPLCDHLEITPKIIQKLVEFSMSENLLQASIQVQIHRLLLLNIDKIDNREKFVDFLMKQSL